MSTIKNFDAWNKFKFFCEKQKFQDSFFINKRKYYPIKLELYNSISLKLNFEMASM